MSSVSNGFGFSDGPTTISDGTATIRLSADLVAAARRELAFLRTVAEAHWLHQTSNLIQAVRRYEELWMPLISDLTTGSTTPPLIILQPPLDIQWVWHCHTLNPVRYRRYCESRFSRLVGKSIILDDENEEYALNRCRDVWSLKYPSEPFELEPCSEVTVTPRIDVTNNDLFHEVSRHKSLHERFSEPYMSEIVYLISASQRYKGFLYLLKRVFSDGCPCSGLVPTLDIQLIWITHQNHPLIYLEDTKDIEVELGKVVIGVWEARKDEEIEATKKLWERVFDEPYEKAGCSLHAKVGSSKRSFVNWEASDIDLNTKYKFMEPRFVLEVCVFVKTKEENVKKLAETKNKQKQILKLKPIRCHKELKVEKPISSFPSQTWRKAWHLYCEFGTRGVSFGLRNRRRHRGNCCRITSSSNNSSSESGSVFLWNDLLRAPCLAIRGEVGENLRAVVSITPPIQAPYLLKCVPDRVTDDSGAMISDVILKMNRYRPQEGRWLSRTVLDHAGRECFVVRIRMGDGFWRRGGETPVAVKWEDRVIEIREGSWSYVAGSIGMAPEKVVGTARPKEESSEESEGLWSFSTGDELSIRWNSSSGLSFQLRNDTSHDSVKLLKGRRLQYEVGLESKEDREEEDEEEEFVTIVRYTSENPNGKATALINWKLLAMELLPEEDAVLVLLISMAILRSVSEMAREDQGSLLVRRRLKEAKFGSRDWGSVILHPSCSPVSYSHLQHLQPWHWNAKGVVASLEADDSTQPKLVRPLVEGGDNLYKKGITSRA